MTPYHTPGSIDELGKRTLTGWNEALSLLFDDQIEFTKKLLQPDAPRAWLFNPIRQGIDSTVQAVIKWSAFPRRILVSGLPPVEGWKFADADRDRHEEYCEWEIAKDAQGRVVRVTFTCETEDYFDFLHGADPDLLLRLYRQHVSPQVELAQLRRADGSYDPQNVWNYPQRGASTRGILMHMGQVNNSFGAAVNLAAVATWPRVDRGAPVIGEQELIACAKFGAAVRHSDPHIGAEINKLVRSGNEVSFADPVGLYIDEVDLSDFEVPQGVPPEHLMRVVRGDAEHMLRVVFEAPPGSGFTLGDVKIGGDRIRFGGQIAEKIQVRLTGIARPAGAAAPLVSCDNTVTHALLQASEVAHGDLIGNAKSRVERTISILSPE